VIPKVGNPRPFISALLQKGKKGGLGVRLHGCIIMTTSLKADYRYANANANTAVRLHGCIIMATSLKADYRYANTNTAATHV